MDRLNSIYVVISRFKYIIVIVFGIVFLGFVDSNSFYKMWELSYEANELRDEIAKYNKQYESDRKQLRALERSPKNITKIAREKYFMKSDDEDIFVLSSDQKQDDENQDE